MNVLTQYKGLRKENYILFLGRLVTNLGAMIWPMMTMILSQKMGMDASKVAIIMCLSGIVLLPASSLGGRLADRYNKKYCIIFCDLISIIFYISCACIPLSTTTVILMIIAAACQNMEWPSYNALVADMTHTKDRERAYSLQYLGANIGLVASPTIAGFLFKDYLWLSFLISGMAIGLSTFLIFWKVQDITPVEEEDEASAYQKSQTTESLWSILKSNKVMLLYIAIVSIYEAAYMQYSYLMPLDMGRVHGENGAVIYGSVSSLNCIVVVLCTPWITRVFHKMSLTWKTMLGQLFILAGFLVFLSLLGHIPAYYAAITLFTFGEIFNAITMGPYMTARIPASHRGRINGLTTVTQGLMRGICMLAIGSIYDRYSYKVAWLGVNAMLLVGIAATAVLIFVDRKVYRDLY